MYKLDSLIELGIDSQAFPGAQILVRYKDSILLHKSWGYHTYDNIHEVQLDDIYDLASVTKVTTGLPILMKLHGEGKIKLDEPIENKLKVFRKSNKAKLSLRNILAHQAGLIPYIVFWQETLKKNGKYKCRTFKKKRSNRFDIRITDTLFLHRKYYKKMEKAIKKSQVEQAGNYKYSGLTFLLLPKLIEEITDLPFRTYLYDSIYTQIGAHELKYRPLQYFPKERIIPTEYDSVWRKQLVHGRVHDEAAAMLNGVSCNAGLFGSARSLSDLFQLYLNFGEWKGEQILKKSSVEEFISYQYEDNRRGLGFDKPLLEYNPESAYVSRDASSNSFGHSGFTGTMVWADPDHDLIFIFLSNRVYPSRSHRKLYSLSLRPNLHQAVYDYILTLDETKPE